MENSLLLSNTRNYIIYMIQVESGNGKLTLLSILPVHLNIQNMLYIYIHIISATHRGVARGGGAGGEKSEALTLLSPPIQIK